MPYDSTPVFCQLAGAGSYSSSTGVAAMNISAGQTKTFLDATNTVGATGVLTHFRLATNSPTTDVKISEAKFVVYRIVGGDLVLVSSQVVDLSGGVDIAPSNNYNEVELDQPVPVIAGDITGVVITAGTSTAGVRVWPSSSPLIESQTLMFNTDVSDGNIVGGLAAADQTFATQPIAMAAFGNENLYLLKTNLGPQDYSVRKGIPLAFFPGLQDWQYCRVAGVTCEDDSVVTLTLYGGLTTTGNRAKIAEIIIDRSTDVLTWLSSTGATLKTLQLADGETDGSDTFDLIMPFNVETGEMMFFLHYPNGAANQAFGFRLDDKIIVPVAGGNFGDNTNFSPVFEPDLQAASALVVEILGNAETAVSVTGMRKPIVAVGDSITDDNLPYVGSILEDAFSETRFVFNIAVGGAAFTRADGNKSKIQQMFEAGPAKMPGVVGVLGNGGGGLNDVRFFHNGSDEDLELAATMINAAQRSILVAFLRGNQEPDGLEADGDDKFGGRRDVVMMGYLPVPESVGHTSQETKLLGRVAELFKNDAAKFKVPYVDVSSYDGTYSGSHPTQPDQIAPLLRAAYETPILIDNESGSELQHVLEAIQAIELPGVNDLATRQELADLFGNVEVERRVYLQFVASELKIVRGDHYNGIDSPKLTWNSEKTYSVAKPVNLIVFDGDTVVAQGVGSVEDKTIVIDNFEAEFQESLFTGNPLSAKLRYAVIAGTKETLRFGRCNVEYRADID